MRISTLIRTGSRLLRRRRRPRLVRFVARMPRAAKVGAAALGAGALGVAGFIWGAPYAARLVMETIDEDEARDNERELMEGERTVLAVGAHPDDLDYYAAGTLARLASKGDRVVAVACTSGEKAGLFPLGRLGRERLKEQKRSAQVQGLDRLEPLGLPDGRLAMNQHQLRTHLREVFHQVRPEVVICFDPVEPMFPGYVHPDHQASGAVAFELADELSPPPLVLCFHSRRPNTVVDITSTIEAKVLAKTRHHSQLTPARHGIAARHLRQMARGMGAAAGYDYAEVFRRAHIGRPGTEASETREAHEHTLTRT